MNPQIRYLILLSCSPVLAFISHMVLARVISGFKWGKLSPLIISVVAVLTGFAIIGAGAWQLSLRHMPAGSERFAAILYGLAVYSGLSFSYFQLFAMTETARRIRILSELELRGPLKRHEITGRYSANDILSVRLERLLTWRQLERADNRYILKGRFLYRIAKIMESWAWVLGFLKDQHQ